MSLPQIKKKIKFGVNGQKRKDFLELEGGRHKNGLKMGKAAVKLIKLSMSMVGGFQ